MYRGPTHGFSPRKIPKIWMRICTAADKGGIEDESPGSTFAHNTFYAAGKSSSGEGKMFECVLRADPSRRYYCTYCTFPLCVCVCVIGCE